MNVVGAEGSQSPSGVIEVIVPGGGTSVGSRVGGNSKGNRVRETGAGTPGSGPSSATLGPLTVSSDPRKIVNSQFPLVCGK